MKEHPRPEELRRFVAGELSQEEARKVMVHVLQGCQFCGEEAARYNLLRLSRMSQPASTSSRPQSRATVGDRRAPAFASLNARSKM